MKICSECNRTFKDDVEFCPTHGPILRTTSGLEPGAVIRRTYRIEAEIGRGGMGVVYRAKHLIWNEDKALKILTSEGAGAEQGLNGLLAEAQVMRKLNHPNIVCVEAFDYTEYEQPFVVMEYVEGRSLSARIQSAGVLPPDLAVRFAAETCSALSAAHAKGILHRDIKPANLLLTQDAAGNESVKVIDFGIAKVRENAGLGFTGVNVRTLEGYLRGSPAYMSPEQVQGIPSGELDGRSDVYSVGVVLYEMLTGRWPFSGDSEQALAAQRLMKDPLPLEQARPGMAFAPELSAVVMKALARDRAQRFGSAEDMRLALAGLMEEWRAAYQTENPKANGGTTVPPRKKTRSLAMMGALAGLVVALMAIGAFLAAQYKQKQQWTGKTVAEAIEAKPGTPDPQLEKKTDRTAADPTQTDVVVDKTPDPVMTTALRANTPPPLEPTTALAMVRIPAGKFDMGCSLADSECLDDEKQVRTGVFVPSFQIGQYLVTQAQFEHVMHRNPSKSSHGPQFPVDSVTWNEAMKFCAEAIPNGTLPTEEQWEYAARAGNPGARYGNLDAIAWYSANSGGHTNEVGQKAPNAYGLRDMLGNLWQWTTGAAENSDEISLRGGSWFNDPGYVRVSLRSWSLPDSRINTIGFRCVGE